MNNILKTLLAAATFTGISLGSAMAVDYTWQLSALTFGLGSTESLDPFAEPELFHFDGGTASGTFKVTDNGSSFSMVSFDITTTLGNTGISAHYSSALGGTTSSGDGYETEMQFEDGAGNLLFLVLPGSGQLRLGASIPLDNLGTYEDNLGTPAEFPGDRWGGSGDCSDGEGGLRICEGSPGQLSIAVTRTPEPASMALLGVGLVGLVASRRRAKVA